MVEFFAPWCGHCKELAPKYETAAFLASVETEPARAMARVDCDEAKNKNICLEHDVTTVPKIKVFHEGDGYDYEGGFDTQDEIYDGLKLHAQPDWSPPEPPSVVTLRGLQGYREWARGGITGALLVYRGGSNPKEAEKLRARLEAVNAPATINDRQREDNRDPMKVYAAQINLDSCPDFESNFHLKSTNTSLMVVHKGFLFPLHRKWKEGLQDVFWRLEDHEPVQVHRSWSSLQTLVNHGNKFVAVGIFKSTKDPKYNTFAAACTRTLLSQSIMIPCHALLGVTEPASVRAGAVSETFPVGSITCVQPVYYRGAGERAFFRYKGDFEAEKLADWIEKDALPTQVHLLSGDGPQILTNETRHPRIGIVFGDFGWDKDRRDETAYWRDVFWTVAQTLQSKGAPRVQFIMAESASNQGVAESLGVDVSADDAALGMRVEKKKYCYKGDVTDVDQVVDFILRVLSQKVKPFVRSAKPPPARRNRGPVKVVVGSTFQKIVESDRNNDVLIEFYAPWCSYCRRLAPEFTALAKKKKKEGKALVFAKIDVTNNDFNESKYPFVHGLPSLYLVRRGEPDRPVPYDGHNTGSAIGQFLDAVLAGNRQSADPIRTEDDKTEL